MIPILEEAGFKEEQISDENFTLEKLVPEIVSELKTFEEKYDQPIPLIAAGGIYTGRDIHEILKLGASGVQMGTRFVATDECDADERFKQSYVAATEQDLVIIKSPVGMPGRAINNEFLESVANGSKMPSSCI